MHRLAHLLVEQHVVGELIDRAVHPDPKLAESARPLVGVEDLGQQLRVAARAVGDDLAGLEGESHIADLSALAVERHIEVHLAVNTVDNGGGEHLAAGEVFLAVIVERVVAGNREGEIGLVAGNDPNLVGVFEPVGQLGLKLALGVPVEADSVPDEILVGLGAHPGKLGVAAGRKLGETPAFREPFLLNRLVGAFERRVVCGWHVARFGDVRAAAGDDERISFLIEGQLVVGGFVLLAGCPEVRPGGPIGVGEPDRDRADVATLLVEGDSEILGLGWELDDDAVAGLQIDRVVDDGGGVLADAWIHTGVWIAV